MIYKVFSSGGVGDALIVGLKIQHRFPEVEVAWNHFERHQCHGDPILDIQKQFVKNAIVSIRDKPEEQAKEMCSKSNGIYIDTVITNFINPYLKKPLSTGKPILNLDLKDHVIIHMHAGRMHDNTKRTIAFNVIDDIRHKFLNKKIMLVGPEPVDLDFPNCINLTGKTESVLEAMQAINGCCLFVGQDGVLAYYAMMLKKPALIAFHLPNLVNHYWNGAWALHSLAIIGAGNTLNSLPSGEKIEQLFELCKPK
ncbi:MAG: hypothetical protein ACXADW_02935 [Candidatus Hodarchaeales archaeon]|jgi:hypothetical protein